MTLGRSPSNYNGEFILGLENTALFFTDYRNSYGFDNVGSQPSVMYGTRVHVAVVKDGTTLTYYVNGAFDSLYVGSSITYINQDFVLGYDWRDGNSYYTGVMDNINVYNVAMSANSIYALYASTGMISTSITVMCWKPSCPLIK